MTGNNHFDPLELLTVIQLAELAKQSESTIRRRIQMKEIRAVHLGRSTRIPRVEAARYLAGDQEESGRDET